MYKITFFVTEPISFTFLPVFDDLLCYCYIKDKYGIVQQKSDMTESEIDSFEGLPLVKHENGYFMASWLQYDKELSLESICSWKKRWANKHDHQVSFNGKVEKVRTNAGRYKSYSVPIPITQISNNKVWFFFQSENVKEVERLISENLIGLFKKRSQGFGAFDSFLIEEINYNPFERIIRPIPAQKEDLNGSIRTQIMGWKSPYWHKANQTYCILP